MDLYILDVEALERAVARLLKEDQDGHDLTRVHAPPSSSLLTRARGEQFLLPQRLKLLPERIHRAEQVEYPHDDISITGMTGSDNRIMPAGRCPVYPELALIPLHYFLDPLRMVEGGLYSLEQALDRILDEPHEQQAMSGSKVGNARFAPVERRGKACRRRRWHDLGAGTGG